MSKSDNHNENDLISRRDLIQSGLYTGAGLMFAGGLNPLALASSLPDSSKKPKAKAVIQIWLWGGPCHIDTFDPKPEAGSDYTGPLNSPIKTNVDGIRINELLPLMAAMADKYSLIRSMTHGSFAHETASYITQTGRAPGGRVVYPGIGAVVSHFKGAEMGYKGLIPPYIVMTELQGRFSEAGFLGSKGQPFATGGDPAKTPFAVEGVIAEGMTTERQKARRELMHNLNSLDHALAGNSQLAAFSQSETQAYDLILGDAGKVFDLSQEKDVLREGYGRTTFGQSCLMARRLVERGVPFVTINYKGWDTHKEHFQTMRRKLPEMDKGISSLLADLSQKGLLDSTIVLCCGEFGRTPKVMWESPWNGGRGHFGAVFSAMVAGGGFKGGQVLGSSDAHGEEVKDRPVYPCDLIQTIYEQMGIDPSAKLPHPQGLDVTVCPSPAEGVKSGGKLKELV